MKEDQIEKLEKEIAQKKKKIQQIKKKRNEKERKERTRRLIVLGGMIEKALDMKLEEDDLYAISTTIEKNKEIFLSDIMKNRRIREQQKEIAEKKEPIYQNPFVEIAEDENKNLFVKKEEGYF